MFNSVCESGTMLYQNRENTKHGLLNFKWSERQKPLAHKTICLNGWHQQINLFPRGAVIDILNVLVML